MDASKGSPQSDEKILPCTPDYTNMIFKLGTANTHEYQDYIYIESLLTQKLK